MSARTAPRSLACAALCVFAIAGTPALAAAAPDVCTPLPEESTARVLPIDPRAARELPPALRLPGDVRPTSAALSLNIDPAQPRFSGLAAIALQLDQPRSTIWIHGRDLHVTESHIDLQGARLPVKYEQVNEGGLVRISLPCAVAGRALLTIAWDAPFGEQLAGLYVAKEKQLPYAFTQFEVISARRAFPGFDEPAFKIPWDIELVVPAKDVAISNTSINDDQLVDAGMRRVRFNTTAPLPTYLLAFAVGPFDVVPMPPLPPNEVRDHPLPIRGIAPQGRGGELRFALEATAALLPRLEAWFGIGFPYEKLDQIAVPDFAWGAMENAGAITYCEEDLLFSPSIEGLRAESNIAVTMAHEMAHQWFGDLVTLRWWTDAWLNESFAAWMETRTVEEWRPELRAQIGQLARVHAAMLSDATLTARAIRKPVEDEASIWNEFDSLTYEKGARLLSMIEAWIGPANFRKGIQKYLRAHAGGSGSSDDLFAALSEAAGRDVGAPMRSFLDQPGVPRVHARLSCVGKTVKVLLEQERSLPVGAAVSEAIKAQRWQLPICINAGVLGETLSACTLLTEKTGELELPGKRCPDWLMPNQGGLGYFHFSLNANDLELLIKGRGKQSVPERASLAANLLASYWQSRLPVTEAAHALEALSHDREPTVSLVLADLLADAHEHVLDPALRPTLEGYARRTYSPLGKKVGWIAAKEDDLATRDERTAVLTALALTARDGAVREEGKRRGLAYAHLEAAAFDSSAVPPELASLALALAVKESGPEVRLKLIERLATEEQVPIRARILDALSELRDATATPALLALSLDSRLRQNERLQIPSGQLSHDETRAAAVDWIEGHWDALLARIPADSESNLVRSLAQSSCERAQLNAIESFLRPRIAKVPGAALELEQGLEAARLCISRREAQAKSFAVLFGKSGK